MNNKQFNILLINAILLTLLALWVHRMLPSKHLVVFKDIKPHTYIFGTQLNDGSSATYWVDEAKRHWQCNSPERPHDSRFICSAIMDFGADGTGIDLSGYTQVLLSITHKGTSKKIRFYARNFDSHYSTLDDPNSAKFNAINLDTAELNKPVTVALSELKVADWWLLQYNIPRANSNPDFRNITEISVDFESNVVAGIQDVEIHSIEFVGEWIKSETWYLSILFIWLSSIFIYASNQLRLSRKQTDEFRHLSTIDPLTQCFNRYGIQQVIDRLLDLSEPIDNSRYSLILIDIDFFKLINDSRGHDAGDRVLQTISKIVQQRIRKTDFLGRWGGEEFIVILPHARKEFALAFAEKIRLAISDTAFENNPPLNITASFGVTQQQNDEDFSTTFKRADNALYAAKNQGRNCCVMAEEEKLTE